jgi:hypothetical protein
MKKLLILIIITLISFNSNGQDSFEGLIKFTTEITTTDLAPQDLQRKLTDKYGDSLVMYYSKTGDFRRVHLNSAAEKGMDSQYYYADIGMLILINKDGTSRNTLDTNINSLKIISESKIDSQKIMDLDCDCYEYKATSKYNQKVTLNFCFSQKSPQIDYKLYSKHKDFFLDEYYEMSKRPYLKFSLETDKFKTTYTATELIKKPIENDIFLIK